MHLWAEGRRVRDVTKVKVKVPRFHVFSGPTISTGIQEMNHQDRPTGQALMVISDIQVLPHQILEIHTEAHRALKAPSRPGEIKAQGDPDPQHHSRNMQPRNGFPLRLTLLDHKTA
jgi:hypothetical protein